MTRQIVVTYRVAWNNAQIELCARHADDDLKATQQEFGTIADVQHGMHEGICAMCRRENGAKKTQETGEVVDFS